MVKHFKRFGWVNVLDFKNFAEALELQSGPQNVCGDVLTLLVLTLE